MPGDPVDEVEQSDIGVGAVQRELSHPEHPSPVVVIPARPTPADRTVRVVNPRTTTAYHSFASH
ncbi:hypothetical protein SCATT_25750 [Streptantibioticus cattleyicolor NRRL 8057 = DSM 46488]|uniref:Uncharacterized protein n=1 Tax=Streptantibioticus cattleyicolor (strain ATCC 35852 / DSM 46488 / JCM 4925 / NBRC 14057 / NRRL 8057) TaxID=1003195 RepID=G8WWQ9_STREN|nr:hypothetical protein SCATT_25750 [Streptantibioticus cattleyicolor NRRL 8057 = DSM 46488]